MKKQDEAYKKIWITVNGKPLGKELMLDSVTYELIQTELVHDEASPPSV